MMAVQNLPQYTTLTDLANDISDVLKTYRSNVLAAIADNIDECGDIFIGEAGKVSPKDTGDYSRSWSKKKLRKQKYSVIVGNTKKVKRHHKDAEPAIPLINILEFGTGWRRRPHVSTALDNSEDQITNTIASAIQKESN